MKVAVFLLLVALLRGHIFSQSLPTYPLAPEPDDRFKADILVIVAHPDDEGMAIGYLAKAVIDEHKRVAVVYGTRGDGGGNAVGFEQAAALGAEREMEARRAVGSIGITNVWFLGTPDTPGQDVLRSLETWNHGSALWQVVRLIRLTRPQVILTWLPAYVVGENHGDHQAASVLATEGFDLAGDPTVFPEQVAVAKDHTANGNLAEGLHTWQAQKLYFFSDTANPAALDGKGPEYAWEEMSPARHVTYGRLALESIAQHSTQDYPGQMAAEALKKGDLGPLQQMKTRLVLGKSLVKTSIVGDVFEGTETTPLAFKKVRGYEWETASGLTAELGGAWAFYRKFWKAHELSGVADLFAPQMGVGVSSEASIPVLLHNDTAESLTLEVTAAAPAGWGAPQGTGRYPLRPQESRAVQISLRTPAKGGVAQDVRVRVSGPAGVIAELAVAVSVN